MFVVIDKAYEEYKPDTGVPLEAYLHQRVNYYIRQSYRKAKKTITTQNLEDVYSVKMADPRDYAEEVISKYDFGIQLKKIKDSFAFLNIKDRKVISLIYEEGNTLDKVAEILNTSKTDVFRCKERALEVIRSKCLS